MKKKLLFFACCLMSMFLLCSCSGKSAEEETYGGHSKAELESSARGLADELTAMSAEDVMQAQLYYSMYGSKEENGEMFAGLLSDWMEVPTECGQFSGYGEFTVEKSGKTYTAKLPIDYSKRDVELVFVYNAFDMELTAINVNLVYSTGEIMKKAGLNTLMGIGTVFIILILISLLIKCFAVIPKIQKKLAADKEAPVVASPETLEQVRAEELSDYDDGELIAVIAAAIAASTGTSTDSFVVRSIRRMV